MSQFSNYYWSADYKSGIDHLYEQTHRSIQQTHELRQLVFNYMSYFHSNSEYLAKLSIDSFTLDSTFRPYDPSIKSPFAHQPKGNKALKKISESFRSVSLESSPPLSKIVKPSSKQASVDGPITMGSAWELSIQSLAKESKNLQLLASVIDREVLEKISAFIKYHEAQVRKILDDYVDLFETYEETYNTVEKLKGQYDELIRLQELSETTQAAPMDHHITELKEEDQSFDSNAAYDKSTDESNDETNVEEKSDFDFDFPLVLGSIKVRNVVQLSSFFAKLTSSVQTIKRKIPIPGYKNEIFSSDQLCDYITKHRPFGVDPTRANLERFGQSLIDHKFLIGTGFLGANKFKSEGMWFEWSDLALYIAAYKEHSVQPETPTKKLSKDPNSPPYSSTDSPHTPRSKRLTIDENTTKFMNETSKRFNGMFKSMRSSLLKNNYSEQLVEVEEKYNENYLELQHIKYLLDLEISTKSHTLENFEKAKIRLIYQSLAKLSEIIYNSSLASTNNLHEHAKDFIERVNKPENYDTDFQKLLDDFSTGIYFPSFVSPNNLTKKHFSTNQSNNNFQNLKRQFNLYKDIQLHIQLSSLEDEHSQQPTISSIPRFLYGLIKSIESKKSDSLSKLWNAPLNHQDYWSVKEQIIGILNAYVAPSDLDVSQESTVHSDMLDVVIDSFKTVPATSLINYLKNWLLEISDSIIPYLVYDPIINLYKDSSELNHESRVDELCRLMGSIPRSNLASLIFILEHIAKSYGLDHIPSYESFEESSQEVESNKLEAIDLNESIKNLNSMDQIGSVPFIHLIFRPSPVKNSSGFKPPLGLYQLLLEDLLNLQVRIKLLKILVNNEKSYRAKRGNEKIGLKKLPSIPPPTISAEAPSTPSKSTGNRTIVTGTIPKSPRPLSGENFTLRPFRTKATPNPSPSGSPRHTPSGSVDLNSISDYRIRKRETPMPPPKDATPSTRPRSTSSSYLTPNIDVEFESK